MPRTFDDRGPDPRHPLRPGRHGRKSHSHDRIGRTRWHPEARRARVQARADARASAAATAPTTTRERSAGTTRVSRVVLLSAIAAVAVLVLLLPVTPLVGIVLLSSISLGVVATLVRRGEDRRSTGETLEGLGTKGYLLLADRVAPGLTGTIRHLVIGPGGVFVVETRDQPGRVRIRGDQLIIGRLSHSVASQLRAQVGAVATTLAPILDGTGATVVPLICMRHAEMPLLHRSVAGIPLLRESQLERRISRSTPGARRRDRAASRRARRPDDAPDRAPSRTDPTPSSRPAADSAHAADRRWPFPRARS